MRKTGLIAAAALLAVALPLTMATNASAQSKASGGLLGGGGGGGGGRAAAPAGGGMKAGNNGLLGGGGGGAFRGGQGPRMGGGPGMGAGPRVGMAPQGNWSGPRTGWNGGPRYHGRRYIGPGVAFGTGLLLGGAYAASPYYYGNGYAPYGYDEPYDDGYVYAAPAQSSPDDVAYCQQRYRSYDPASGTYLNNDGNRYPCP